MGCGDSIESETYIWDDTQMACGLVTTTMFQTGQPETSTFEFVGKSVCCAKGTELSDDDLLEACCDDPTDEVTFTWSENNRACISQTLEKQEGIILNAFV